MLLPTGAVRLLGKYVRTSQRKDAVNTWFWWQEDVRRSSVLDIVVVKYGGVMVRTVA